MQFCLMTSLQKHAHRGNKGEGVLICAMLLSLCCLKVLFMLLCSHAGHV